MILKKRYMSSIAFNAKSTDGKLGIMNKNIMISLVNVILILIS